MAPAQQGGGQNSGGGYTPPPFQYVPGAGGNAANQQQAGNGTQGQNGNQQQAQNPAPQNNVNLGASSGPPVFPRASKVILGLAALLVVGGGAFMYGKFSKEPVTPKGTDANTVRLAKTPESNSNENDTPPGLPYTVTTANSNANASTSQPGPNTAAASQAKETIDQYSTDYANAVSKIKGLDSVSAKSFSVNVAKPRFEEFTTNVGRVYSQANTPELIAQEQGQVQKLFQEYIKATKAVETYLSTKATLREKYDISNDDLLPVTSLLEKGMKDRLNGALTAAAGSDPVKEKARHDAAFEYGINYFSDLAKEYTQNLTNLNNAAGKLKTLGVESLSGNKPTVSAAESEQYGKLMSDAFVNTVKNGVSEKNLQKLDVDNMFKSLKDEIKSALERNPSNRTALSKYLQDQTDALKSSLASIDTSDYFTVIATARLNARETATGVRKFK